MRKYRDILILIIALIAFAVLTLGLVMWAKKKNKEEEKSTRMMFDGVNMVYVPEDL